MTVRWGVIATGGIAARFTEDLRQLTGPDAAEVVAVGSRSIGRAEEFAAAHGVPRAYGSYEELVADRGVDAVYVATPHPGHHDAAMLAIDAGRAVLLEKPFTMDAAEARSLVAAARERGVFLMEAMWTRFLPPVVRLRERSANPASSWRRTASSSRLTRRTGCTPRSSVAARCSTWGSIRCRSCQWCWDPRRVCWRQGRPRSPVSTPRRRWC